jgi:hypothetical protein
MHRHRRPTGSGQRELLRPCWPRSRIAVLATGGVRSPYLPPSLASSRRAAVVKVSRTQLDRSPVPLRAAATSAARRTKSSVSRVTRTRSMIGKVCVGSFFGRPVLMPGTVALKEPQKPAQTA